MAAGSRANVTLAADVAGYPSLIGAQQEGALKRLEAHRDQLVYPRINEHDGHVLKAAGDALLVEFDSPIDAVHCAVEIQRGMIDRNDRSAPAQRIMFRVGIHIDEVTTDRDDLVIRAVAALPVNRRATLIRPGSESYADSKAAVRLATLAEAGGICISAGVWDAIRDQLQYRFDDIGEQNLDIHRAPVRCYGMSADSVAGWPSVALPEQRDRARRNRRLRNATVAAGVSVAVGIWAMALWAWLGANPSTAPSSTPITVASPISAISSTAVADAKAALAPQPSGQNNGTADRDIKAPPQDAPNRENTELDGSLRAPSPRPIIPEIGAAVIRGKETPSALQTTPESGAVIVRGIQAPSAQPTTPSSPSVVRGKGRL